MWIYLALGSAVLLGLYDIAKKQATSKNGVLQILLVATALSTIFLSPFLFKYETDLHSHVLLFVKGLIVSISWISGMIALKLLPITTVSTLKATRPFLVVLLSIILFHEKLNALQWGGILIAIIAIWLLGGSSRQEGISFKNNKGWWALIISIVSGVLSALYDKHIITGFNPLTVQSWGNFYITLILGTLLILNKLQHKTDSAKFNWDWTLLLIAVFITLADAMYFFAIKQDGALLSVISIIRRCSVIVTFVFGALFFKEKNIKRKSVNIIVLMIGMVLLIIGSH